MMGRKVARSTLVLVLLVLTACTGRISPTPAPSAAPTAGSPSATASAGSPPAPTGAASGAQTPAVTAAAAAAAATPGALPTAQAQAGTGTPSGAAGFPAAAEPTRYHRLAVPLAARADSPQASLLSGGQQGLQSGPYRLAYDGKWILITGPKAGAGLALTLPGGDALNALGSGPTVDARETPDGPRLTLTGQTGWGARFQASLFAYARSPGLFRWRVELLPGNGKAPADPQPELQFVDSAGAETSGGLDVYADHAAMAAPHIYGYSATLDSTLFYWVDLTALNPFMQAAHYTPSATPGRQGNRLGHVFTASDLGSLPAGQATAVYDSYLYLASGKPASEDAMFLRYLQEMGDLYDLMAVPADVLPDWFGFMEWTGQGAPQGVQGLTLRDLANDKAWVTINGKRYLRAYVADTRQSAELISQLDVYEGVARYQKRFTGGGPSGGGPGGEAPAYARDLRAAIPDFFNGDVKPSGMFQNPGPVAAAGPAKTGDVWYELGHALKVAELALADPQDTQLADLALRSAATWMEFAHAAQYRFPQAYTLGSWKGGGREPDAAGAYAYFMLLARDLATQARGQAAAQSPNVYLDEARKALHALDGYGFKLAYETHMTAITAAAAARMYQIEPDALYLNVINRAAANLMRLSWAWEDDYGWWQEGHSLPKPPFPATGDFPRQTFFGLNPTQASAVITPKEQYEAWIYVMETLQRAHGKLDPAVEKLLAEFEAHTLQALPHSLAPLMPPGAATAHPAAYDTVRENDLSLFIPLEDVRDGWDVSGAIGQEVYGAGMAPTMAALSIVQAGPGVQIYSAYPVVKTDGDTVTFAGVTGTYAPAAVIGASSIVDGQGRRVETASCGKALCFQTEGGATYRVQP